MIVIKTYQKHCLILIGIVFDKKKKKTIVRSFEVCLVLSVSNFILSHRSEILVSFVPGQNCEKPVDFIYILKLCFYKVIPPFTIITTQALFLKKFIKKKKGNPNLSGKFFVSFHEN